MWCSLVDAIELSCSETESSAIEEAAISQTSDALVEMGAPILNNLGFSGVAGLSVAVAVKVPDHLTKDVMMNQQNKGSCEVPPPPV